ncbi:MAG: hypothetical protein P9L94_13625 [Candidatus Hinthialibacter antarcticus]|nr:hypothetical protein [Candidatus Hinthialibacter antarcticus]
MRSAYLPFDRDLVNPEGLLQWIKELGIEVEFSDSDQYPRRPVMFSAYQMEPPRIRIYRYSTVEEQFNLISQQQAGYYGPWYCLHLAFRLYFHLEINGMYETPRSWRHKLFGGMESLEERAYAFAHELLGCRYNPARFDYYIDKALEPGGTLS